MSEYEIVCLDENGGIARAMQGAFSGLDTAVAAAAARAPQDCSRILLCAVETNSVVWQGSRDDAIETARVAAERGPKPRG